MTEPPAKTVALVFVMIPAHFREMIRVAELLKASPRYDPVVLFPAAYAGYEEDVERCLAQAIRVVVPDHFWGSMEPEKPDSVVAAALPGAPVEFIAPQFVGPEPRILKAWEVDTVKIPARGTPLWAYMVAYDLSLRSMRFTKKMARAVWSGTVYGVLETARQTVIVGRRTANAAFHALRDLTWATGRTIRRIPVASIARTLGVLTLPFRSVLRWGLLFWFGRIFRTAPALLPSGIVLQRQVFDGLERFLERYDVGLLVLPEDNFYYFTNFWIRKVHARGGAAVIVPFTIANILEWSESFYNAPTHDAENAVNWLIAGAFPRWVHHHKGKALVMPPEYVLVNEYLRITPPTPWLINSGVADAIAVESEYTARYYRNAGIAPEQIRVTGALSDDVVYGILREGVPRREALYAELGLPAGRPMILCALPPNQLAGYGRPGCEFDDYVTLLRFFLEPLEMLADEYNIVVNLHPRITPEQSSFLAGSRAGVSRRNIAELIPLSSIFVACVSATIRIGVECAIPVVNYDVYRYDYDDFKGIPGVLEVQTREQYREAVNRLARDSAEFARVRDAQAAFAEREMRIDGRAGERLLALFDELVRRRASLAAAA